MSEPDRIREYFASATWKRTPGRVLIVDERFALMREYAIALGKSTASIRVCDVGCGVGLDLMAWRSAGVGEDRLAGTEIIPDRITAARRALPNADIREVDGFEVPFDSDSFDLSSASLVVSTIMSSSSRRQLLIEMQRVTAPGGLVLIYDFAISKPWNRNVRRVAGREVAAILGDPAATMKAAPFLPALDIALRLPGPMAGPVVSLLPRTHRLWVWQKDAGRSPGAGSTVDPRHRTQ